MKDRPGRIESCLTVSMFKHNGDYIWEAVTAKNLWKLQKIKVTKITSYKN